MTCATDQSAVSEQPDRCVHCGYDLRGTTHARCPECGKVFDPLVVRRRARRAFLFTLILMTFVVYAPFSWLLFVQDDASYVRSWMVRWPILPGLVPTYLLAGLTSGSPWNEPVASIVMGVFTLSAIMGLVWLARKGRQLMFIITLLVAISLASLNGVIALQLFRW